MENLFCEKCGKILKIENNVGRCSCGFEKELDIEKTTISETIKQKDEKGKGFVHDKNELATFPHLCSKCGHEQAQVIDMGVWVGDEAGVIRYKCGKCGATEQEKGSNS
jgi:DNA-directed RNA polymerase subunit M/transcription elongation factor TFIIS